MNRTRQTKQKPLPRRRLRSGSVTLQIVLVLPILIITTLAMIQLGFLITLRQAVYHAATVGAREAAKGGDIDHVTCVVNSILRTHSLHVGQCVSVILEDIVAANPIVQAGTATCAAPSTPALDVTDVRVSVCVDLSKVPLANMLKVIGICGNGKAFRASSVAQKEVPP